MALKPETKPVKRPRIATYDLEWIPGTLEVRIVGFYDGDSYRDFGTIPAFLNAVLRREYSGTWFYAHAGGKYDVQFVLEAIEGNDAYSVEACFAGSSAIIVRIERGPHTWLFLDSYWLLRAKLRDIATMIGRDKGGIEETPENRDEVIAYFRDTPLPELRAYNEGDCINLYDAIEMFRERLEALGGELKMTVASCAMTLFRRRFLSESIPTNATINQYARVAYIGSRCEVFHKRCRSGYDYDINSSFPAAMQRPLPGRINSRRKTLPRRGPYLARVSLVSPARDIPPLPYRSESTGRIYFPIGYWETWLTDVDVELLLESGGDLVDVKEVITFHANHDLEGYACTLYDWRKGATDEAMRYVLKILLNSLYGKFAERTAKQTLLLRPKEIPPGSTMLRPGVFIASREAKVPHEHVPFSAAITAYARRSLYEWLVKCYETYYCDTDGFVASDRDIFPTSKELGDLKLECEVVEGEFAAPKLYTLKKPDGGRIMKAKGFRRLSYEDFLELAEGREIQIERISGIRENLRRRGSLTPREILVPKKARGIVRPKRKFHPDGSSEPWDVREIEDVYHSNH